MASEQPVEYFVRVEGGPLDRERLSVFPGGLTIGRASTCDVVIEDSGISRRHVMFRVTDGFCFVEDMGSHNGLLVNGAACRKKCLQTGDIVDIGACRFVLESEGAPLERAMPTEFAEAAHKIAGESILQEVTPREIEGAYHPLAFAAVGFGLLTFLHWAFAIGALVLGGWATFEILNRGESKGLRVAVSGMTLGVLIAGLSLIVASVREATPLACRTRLDGIHAALVRYAGDHSGKLPADLFALIPDYVEEPDAIRCPTTGQTYAYAGPDGRLGDSGAPLAWDVAPGAHGSIGGLVLFGNGEVARLADKDRTIMPQFSAGE